MNNTLKPGYISILAVLSLTSIMLIMLAASFRNSVQSQDVQKKVQLRLDYAHREQAILRSVLNIAPNRAMRTMMTGSDINPMKRDLRWHWIFQDAMGRADAESAVESSVASVLGIDTTTISANTANSDYGHANTIVGPLGTGISSGFFVTPGVNGMGSGIANLPEALTLNDTDAFSDDFRWPVITNEKSYGSGGPQHKTLPYPDIHFGYSKQSETFVAKRNWWGFSLKFGAENDGSSNVTTVRKNYVLSIYEVPSQLALGSTSMTFLGKHADGSAWENVSISGGVFASQAETEGALSIDRIASRGKITMGEASTIGDVTVDPITGVQQREDYEAAHSGFFPLSSSSDSGLVAFFSINRGNEAYDDLTNTTDTNRISPTSWNWYSRPAMQCAMKVRVEDVISSSDSTPTRISFTYWKDGFETTDYFTRGVNWPTEDSTEGATFPFHLEETPYGRRGIAVYVGRMVTYLKDTVVADSLAVNHSLLVNSNYRDNANITQPAIPSTSSDPCLIFRDAKDLTAFPNGFSVVTPYRLYLANDVNIQASGTDASGNLTYPPISLFAPEKRFGMREEGINVVFEGQLNYTGKGTDVRPVDFRTGINDDVTPENIAANLYSIKDPSELPPINQMNWLVVIEELR